MDSRWGGGVKFENKSLVVTYNKYLYTFLIASLMRQLIVGLVPGHLLFSSIDYVDNSL